MTTLLRSVAVVAITSCIVALVAPNATAQSADSVDDRKERIASNLQLQFEPLRDAQVVVTELGDADMDGFDIGTVIINGRNAMRFIVTKDDTRLFLLAADGVDVSMTSEEIAAEYDRLEREELAAARQRHEELLVLSEGMPSRGKATAPVTIVEFSDFQCPYCARVIPTVEEVLQKYPDEVRLVFMHLPLSMHPWAEPAAVASTCAARQSEDAFWTLHDYYFENQSTLSPENVVDLSRQQLASTGLDLDQWGSCASDTATEAYQEVLTQVRSSMATANKYGATGTPAFFVNGRFISGAQPLSAFDELIREALNEDA